VQVPPQAPEHLPVHPEHPPVLPPVQPPEQDPEQLPEQLLQPDEELEPEQSFAHPSQVVLSGFLQFDKVNPRPATATNGNVILAAFLKKSLLFKESEIFFSFIVV
jgi:hypothetical protein